MQKRQLDINYGNTNEEELKDGYTFIIPDDNYKNININIKGKSSEDKKEKKTKCEGNGNKNSNIDIK